MNPHCDVHNKDYKGPNSKNKYWHVINYEKGEYCTRDVLEEIEKKPTEAYTPKMAEKAEEIREKIDPEPKVDWEAKDRQSMSQTAMKGATEIMAALINGGFVTQPYTIADAITDVKNTSNQLYEELKGMKAKG